jgi:hypothetical protein
MPMLFGLPGRLRPGCHESVGSCLFSLRFVLVLTKRSCPVCALKNHALVNRCNLLWSASLCVWCAHDAVRVRRLAKRTLH